MRNSEGCSNANQPTLGRPFACNNWDTLSSLIDSTPSHWILKWTSYWRVAVQLITPIAALPTRLSSSAYYKQLL